MKYPHEPQGADHWSNLILKIDQAIDKISSEGAKYVSIAGQTYSLQNLGELRKQRDYAQRRLNEDLAGGCLPQITIGR